MKPLDGYSVYTGAFQSGLMPDPPLLVDEWSEQHMVIPAEAGAAEPGPYRIARTPFARDVLRALSPEHPAKKVVVMGASQLLKTQVGLNWVSAIICNAPANVIVLLPTDKLAKRISSRFDKIAQVVAPLQATVAAKRSRDNRNTLDTKEFNGGTIWFLTGRSAGNLSEASARYIYVDEIDRLLREIQGEGDPIGLVEKRASTYGKKAKFYYTSSPTEEDASRIMELYLSGDQRRYFVPCPHCGEKQTMEWENLQYDLAKGEAWYACSANGCMIRHGEKTKMLAGGEWRASEKGDGETTSYTISALYAPIGWTAWMDLAREFIEAEIEMKKGDPEKMQVFYNTRLARVWSPASVHIKPEDLMETAEDFPLGIIPDAGFILTAGVDVQGNRIEIDIYGWGPGPCGIEPWTVNSHVIYGNPTLDDPWDELDTILKTPIRHATGTYQSIAVACVDSGDGNYTQEVYEFCRMRHRRWINGSTQHVMAIKGSSKPGKPIIAGQPSNQDVNFRGKYIPAGVKLWSVGDSSQKWVSNRIETIMARDEKMRRQAIHFSKDLPIEYYQQLLGEAKQIVRHRGRKITRWIARSGQPIERRDILRYALFGAVFLGLDRFTDERWERERGKLAQADLFIADASDQLPGPDTAKPAGQQPKQPSGYYVPS